MDKYILSLTKDICHGQKIFCHGQNIFCHGQKIFVMDKIHFVMDKKYFVRAEGRGISFQKIIPKFFDVTFRVFFTESLEIVDRNRTNVCIRKG